jgi:hypothetical protein
MKTQSIRLESPIEFAVAGPLGGQDRIVIRSERAGLDLIGLAAQGVEHPNMLWKQDLRTSSDFLSLMFGNTPPLNLVTSVPLYDLKPEFDNRKSSFIFVWKGYASADSIRRVEETLNLQIVDLHRAIGEGDKGEIEWALGPLIYRCARANDRRLRLRRVAWGAVATYILLSIVMLSYLTVLRIMSNGH